MAGRGDGQTGDGIDTLKAATRLREEGGFSEKQATELVATFADGFVENLATKDDVEHLRADVEKLGRECRHHASAVLFDGEWSAGVRWMRVWR